MHISEGILNTPALATGFAIASVGVAVGLKKMDTNRIIRVSLMSSAFFLASLINVKVGPSSTHLSLLAPVGLVLGWSAFPAMCIALLLQALLFQFGGLTVLGANTVDVAVPAVMAWLVFGRLIGNSKGFLSLFWSFVAGASAVLLCAFLVGQFLHLSDPGMAGAAKTIFYAHLPLAVVEGLITAFFVMFLKKAAPDLLISR